MMEWIIFALLIYIVADRWAASRALKKAADTADKRFDRLIEANADVRVAVEELQREIMWKLTERERAVEEAKVIRGVFEGAHRSDVNSR